MRALDGAVCIVTGGSLGIGYGIAEAALTAGARVVITGRDAARLDRAVARLGGHDDVVGIVGDTRDERHRLATVEAAIEKFGRIDLLVNNAGQPSREPDPLADNDEAFRDMLNANVVAPRAWIRAVADAWMAEHGGAVVNVASIAGVRTEKTLSMYAVSKAALIYLTGQLALELAPGIRVNAIAPGFTETATTASVMSQAGVFAAAYPLRRIGTPDDIAPTVIHLLSPDASFITGQTVVIDGGYTLTTAEVQLA